MAGRRDRRGWLTRDAEKPGWRGVSFRGIDGPQYSPDAVDTPICNDPDAISAVARDRVPKMRQGGSYSVSSGLSTRFRARPETTENSTEREFFLGDHERNPNSRNVIPVSVNSTVFGRSLDSKRASTRKLT